MKNHRLHCVIFRFEKSLALSCLGNFCSEVFLLNLNAFANFEANKTGDFCSGFFGRRFNGQVGVHNEGLVQQSGFGDKFLHATDDHFFDHRFRLAGLAGDVAVVAQVPDVVADPIQVTGDVDIGEAGPPAWQSIQSLATLEGVLERVSAHATASIGYDGSLMVVGDAVLAASGVRFGEDTFEIPYRKIRDSKYKTER